MFRGHGTYPKAGPGGENGLRAGWQRKRLQLERLKKLKGMLEEGLITDEQFAQKREEILKEL